MGETGGELPLESSRQEPDPPKHLVSAGVNLRAPTHRSEASVQPVRNAADLRRHYLLRRKFMPRVDAASMVRPRRTGLWRGPCGITGDPASARGIDCKTAQ